MLNLLTLSVLVLVLGGQGRAEENANRLVARAGGDPHIARIGSQTTIDVRASCWHTLLTDMDCPGLQSSPTGTFRITGNFKRNKILEGRSYMSELKVYNKTSNGNTMVVHLQQGPTVTLSTDEITTFPFSHVMFPGISLMKYEPPLPQNMVGHGYSSDDTVVELKLPNGIMLMWNGLREAVMSMGTEGTGPVCGLMGQNYGTSEALIVGPHDVNVGARQGCPGKAASLPVGYQTNVIAEYADSWFYEKDVTDAGCLEECYPGE